MPTKPSKISSLLVATYVAVVVGGTLLHFANTGDVYTLKYSLTRPVTIIAALVGALVAFGLWRSYAWAWWLGLVAAAVQLYRFGPWFTERLINGQVPTGSWLIAFLLLAFSVLHLTKAVRKSCSR
jgi:translocator protein